MPDRLAIYRNDPRTYDLLISREDHEGNLLKALQGICDFSQKDIADVGAGTGRIALLLAPFINFALLTDDAAPMLKLAVEKLRSAAFDTFRAEVSDIAEIPTRDASLDIVLAGWALCSKALRGDPWRQAVQVALEEMARVLKPGGTIVLIESLGTGREVPAPPNARFAEYFAFLEDHGFQQTWTRTDYLFHSLEEKKKLLTFFFDEEMLRAGVQSDALIYPECTGIWWKKP